MANWGSGVNRIDTTVTGDGKESAFNKAVPDIDNLYGHANDLRKWRSGTTEPLDIIEKEFWYKESDYGLYRRGADASALAILNIIMRGPIVDVTYHPGVVGDGENDDTAGIQAVINDNPGRTIYFPLPSAHYYIKNKITVPFSGKGVHLLFAGGNRFDESAIVQIDDSWPAGQPIFNLSSGTIVENLTVYHKGTSKLTGTGLEIGNTAAGSPQTVHILNCIFYKIDTAIVYGGRSYYNKIDNVQAMQCNNGIVFDMTYGTALGSLTVSGFRAWQCNEKSVWAKSSIAGTGNQIEFNNCIFEQTPYHIYSEAGTMTYNKCYIGDGSITPVYINGGIVIIDGRNTETAHGGGSTDFMPFDTGVPTYGVRAISGKIRLKDLTLRHNIHGSDGVVSIEGVPTLFIGADVLSEGGIVETDNVKYDGFYAPKINLNANNRCEEVANYIINGMFMNEAIIDATIVKTNLGHTVLGDNGLCGKTIKLTALAAAYASVDFYYHAPHLVGKIAYLGAYLGDVSSTTTYVPAFYPLAGEFSTDVDWDVYQKYGNVVLDASSYLQPMSGKSGYVSKFHAPILISKPFGKIRFRLFNPAAVGQNIDIAGVYLTDEIHAGKIARFKDVANIILGTAAPTAGTWVAGEYKVLNIAPAAGGYEGWTCTTSGTPGTWKGYGAIQA
jgi:hypothetical protein